MKVIVVFFALAVAGCLPQSVANSEAEPASHAEATVPTSDLESANRRFAECKRRWIQRLSDAEIVLRSERQAREAMANRPDLVEAGMLSNLELKAEKDRLEMDKEYRATDPYGCFAE